VDGRGRGETNASGCEDDWLDQEGSIKFVPVPLLAISTVWNLDV